MSGGAHARRTYNRKRSQQQQEFELMNLIGKKLAIAVLSGASLGGLLAGSSLVRDNTASAQDNPKQGNVQPPAQLSEAEKAQLEGLAGVFKKVGKHVEPAVVQ